MLLAILSQYLWAGSRKRRIAILSHVAKFLYASKVYKVLEPGREVEAVLFLSL